jgi:hypothetical protein
MPELGTYGSVRGVPGNGHPYRDHSRAGAPERSTKSACGPTAECGMLVELGTRLRTSRRAKPYAQASGRRSPLQ